MFFEVERSLKSVETVALMAFPVFLLPIRESSVVRGTASLRVGHLIWGGIVRLPDLARQAKSNWGGALWQCHLIKRDEKPGRESTEQTE